LRVSCFQSRRWPILGHAACSEVGLQQRYWLLHHMHKNPPSLSHFFPVWDIHPQSCKISSCVFTRVYRPCAPLCVCFFHSETTTTATATAAVVTTTTTTTTASTVRLF